jgi:predicted nucleic acid-binding protein
MTEVFLDTSYAIALSVSNDEHHERAINLAEQLEAERTGLVTTRAIFFEIGNALAGLRYRKAAVQLLDALENDPKVEIVPITEELCVRAFELYRNRPDKEWGLIDCISFIIMEERRITDALTADNHFRQAGLRALLKENWT